MASIIRIKRSEVSGNPAVLGAGELAYSGLTDNGSNGGDRLYVGMGTETGGNAVNHVVIGGKFFTDMLDHAKGALTANSALVVDANSKLDNLKVDNLDLNGNVISTLDTNGNLFLTPNGTGKTVVSNLYVGDDATSLQEYIQDVAGGGIAGGTGLTASYNDTSGVTTLSLNNTTVPAGSYGSATAIPTFTVDAQGRLTAAGSVAISSSFTLAADTGTADAFNNGETLTFVGTDPVQTAVSNNTITISVDNATTTTKGIASFSATNFDVSGGAVSIKAGGIANANLVNSSLTIGSTSVALGATTASLAGLTSVAATTFTGALTGNASTATTLQTARSIAISGPITGTATSFNGSSDITIPVTALDVGHANVTGTLPVTCGGTGVTTSTGTGSVVLSASPALTGAPTAPTASFGTNTTQIATTAFVTSAVDAARTGLDVKSSVRAATTANITLSNTQTVDGVALAVGDRVLVKDQATATENGIYIVAGGAWTRATDFDTTTEVTAGAFTFVESGTANADSGWVVSTDGAITVGTTAIAFAQFSGAGQITAGNGLTKTGNTLNVGAGTGLAVNADDIALSGQALALHNLASNGIITRTAAGTVAARTVTGTANRVTVTNGDGVAGNPIIDIASNYVGQSTITTLGTITTGTWNAGVMGVAYGGTGLNTLTSRGIVFGNGTAAAGVTAAATIDGSFLREDSAGNPYWSNVIDGGTY